jgi:hypothetical protein
MRFPHVVLLSACALMLAVPLLAQSPNGVINGLVGDPSNRVIVGADVVVANDVTGVQYTTKTNGEGIYVLPNLPPGPYRLQVSKVGFKTLIKPDIVLNVQDALSINFTLPVGALYETITVEAGAPLVNTANAAVSTVIDRNFVDSLPLNGRSFNTLLQLTPGVVIAPAPLGGAAAPGQFSIAGQRTNANNFTVDGVSANFGVVSTTVTGNSGTGSAQALSALGGTSSLVSVDALQEFRVETSSFAPEFGRSPGGQIILTTRSGTNTLHGGAFEYFRNNVLDANDWFANQSGLPRAPERHNNFGGFLGGPIAKSKTFFFFSYEGARLRLPQTLPTPVPSEYARTTAPSAIAPYLNAFPRPDDRTITPGVYTAVFTGNYSNSATLDATSVRIDHKFNDSFSVFGRYNYAPSQAVNRTNSLNNLQAVTANTQTLTLGVNTLLNGNVSNAVRGNYSAQSANNLLTMDSFGGAVPLDPALLLGSLPISSNLGSFGTNDSGAFYLIGSEARNHTAQLNFVDDLLIAKGTHQLKVGGDYRAIFLDQQPNHSAVFLSADSVQAFVSTGTAGIVTMNNAPAQILSQSLSLYGQDTWKVSPRLTLTYGLRWELAPAPSRRGSTLLASWTNTNDPSRIALAPQGTPIWATTYTNFAPRLGVAYSLTPQSDFVVRAGFGLFYDTTAGSIGALASSFPSNTSGPPPGVPTTVTLPVNDFAPYLSPISLQPPFPPFTTGFANDLQFPRSYQWNLALEKSFGEKQVLSATYVGQVGRDLLRQEGMFQPNANFSFNFLLTGNTARSNYHALQVQYRRPLSGRVQALLNYTWSHSLDSASQDGVVAVSHTVISAARDYANSDFDARHSFSGAITISLPSAAKSGLLSVLTKSWAVDTVIVVRSGFPFNAALVFGGPAGAGLSRPDLVSGKPVWVPDGTAPGGKSLNGTAFTIPPAGEQGTEPRNDISGFGLTQVDLSIARKFAITSRLNLQFRADAFNALNHPNFANPLGLVQLGSFYLSSTRMLNQGLGGLNPLFQEGGPRSLQLSLKLTF